MPLVEAGFPLFTRLFVSQELLVNHHPLSCFLNCFLHDG